MPPINFLSKGDSVRRITEVTIELTVRKPKSGISKRAKILSNIPATYWALPILTNHIPILSKKTHNIENTGAKAKMKKVLTDWQQKD